MSRELYEGLEAEGGLLGELVRLGRVRRAARELASDEYEEGWYVDETEPLAEAERLAADDGEGLVAATYAEGPWRLLVTPSPAGLLVLQQEGPAGGTVEAEGAWAALAPGEGALLAGIDRLPPALVVIDLDGRRWRLARGPS